MCTTSNRIVKMNKKIARVFDGAQSHGSVSGGCVKTGWREIMRSVSFNWKTAKRHLGRAKGMVNKEKRKKEIGHT